MASILVGSELPNLKIEIDNDLNQSIDEDMIDVSNREPDLKDNDAEEGEISDEDDGDLFKMNVDEEENNAGGLFRQDDTFSAPVTVDPRKLEERAKRFGVQVRKPEVSEENLKNLYNYFDIKDTNSSKGIHRLEAIHIRGTEDMSTDDVRNYFQEFNPKSVEWVNDYSCNVVWSDPTAAAEAMLALSKPIAGTVPKKELFDDEPKSEEVVIVSEEVSADGSMTVDTVDTVVVPSEQADNGNKQVDVSKIAIPIPPGVWRAGIPHSKAKGILLRFATRNDKKPFRAERMSEYYKKHGNPNYGGIRGIITQTRKRNVQAMRGNPPAVKVTNPKNPWGSIAENWGVADQTEEIIPVIRPNERPVRGKPVNLQSASSRTVFDKDSSSSDSDSEWTAKIKRPRMRMHADEEEERIKKQRAKGRKIVQRKQDLRDRIRPAENAGAASVWSRIERTTVFEEGSDVESLSEEEQLEDGTKWALEDEDYVDLRESLSRKEPGSDLRSKLNRKKLQRKSPLRIEIDNDEYYKVIDTDTEDSD